MVFSSSAFLYLFLPITLIVYLLIPRKAQNIFLFAVSILFYAWNGLVPLLILLLSIICNYFVSLFISKYRKMKKIFLTAGIIWNLGLLCYFKYTNFFLGTIYSFSGREFTPYHILLPAGISFYIFQQISYLIDVYRGSPALVNPLDLGMYTAMFPQLMAGPIVRYNEIRPYLYDRTENYAQIEKGFEHFLLGLCKKVILADQLAVTADLVFNEKIRGEMSVVLLWLGVITFSLQIYYDFSGYSDMAIGLGNMFGFIFPENFRYPFCAATFGEFWRRWHISLTSWFRDYVYIPLGGSRAGFLRHLLNIGIVWILTGLWHGARWNYVLWGAVCFILLITEKYLIRPERFIEKGGWKILYRTVVLIFIGVMMFVFRSNSLTFIKNNIGILAGVTDHPFCNEYALFMMRENRFFLFFGILFAMPVMEKVRRQRRIIANAAYAIFLLLSVLLAVSFIAIDTYNPFVYFIF